MAETYLFPRLPAAAARARVPTVQGKTLAELTNLTACHDSHVVFGATGGARVPDTVLTELRQKIVEAAVALGFPGAARKDVTMTFDPIVAGILTSCMPIAAGEASRDDVWAFLTLILMPDIATWRFPNRPERRLLGGVKNTFQRLWWRAFLLRDHENTNDPLWLLQLPEDALVGLMERPALSSNPRVTLAIARAIHKLAIDLPSAEREDAWRLAYKRIRQRLVLVNFDFLPDADLNELIVSASRRS